MACVSQVIVVHTAPQPSKYGAGYLTNRLRTGQEARRVQRRATVVGSERFTHLVPKRVVITPVVDGIDDPIPPIRTFRHTFGRRRDTDSCCTEDELTPHEAELLAVDLRAHERNSPPTHGELLKFFALAGIDKQSVQTQSMALKKARRLVRPIFDARVAARSAAREIKADKRKIIATMKRKGSSLRYASDVMRADKDVVMAAVKQCGRALEHANLALRADRDVVLAAVRTDVSALRFASEELRADREIFEIAMDQQPKHITSPKRPRPLVRDHMN
jgi:hypothetical protein